MQRLVRFAYHDPGTLETGEVSRWKRNAVRRRILAIKRDIIVLECEFEVVEEN